MSTSSNAGSGSSSAPRCPQAGHLLAAQDRAEPVPLDLSHVPDQAEQGHLRRRNLPLPQLGFGRADELQDYVAEATHDPWPARRGTPPWPYARVRDRILYLWYGGPDHSEAAGLACEPVPVADLGPA